MSSLTVPLPKDPPPTYRELRVFAIDPAVAQQTATFSVATTALRIRWNDLQAPGPVGQYLEVIDYDPSCGCYYTPVDLMDVPLAVAKGVRPWESDPRFHQQMVYAVAMHTIQTFESVLGRKVLWSGRRDEEPAGNGKRRTVYRYVDKLRIYPHALRAENAYYDPVRKALLFGYFSGQGAATGGASGIVFSALSFDIVTHETTHAILDGLHRRFVEDTNPDILAFHEAFADIVALFQHFSLPDFLRHEVAAARGDLGENTFLAQLAVQFGLGTGHYGALRNAIGTFDQKGRFVEAKLADPPLSARTEPHERGSVLVSAVFGAFLTIYRTRTADLLRIASNGTGELVPGALHPDLVNRLADEASKAARNVLSICIRALDYLPPVDVTFVDYLRALLTADHDAAPDDPMGYRVAFIESFQRWGIFPSGFQPLGESSLLWSRLEDEVTLRDEAPGFKRWQQEFRRELRERIDAYRRLDADGGDVPEEVGQRGLEPPVSLRHGIYNWSKITAQKIHGRFENLGGAGPEVSALFGIIPEIIRGKEDGGEEADDRTRFEVHSVRTLLRPSIDPLVPARLQAVIVLTQRVWVDRDTLEERAGGQASPERDMLFRGGATIVFDLEAGEFRYVIRKDIKSAERRAAQRDHQKGNVRSVYFERTAQPFRMLHEEAA